MHGRAMWVMGDGCIVPRVQKLQLMGKHKISGVLHSTENKYFLKLCALSALFASS